MPNFNIGADKNMEVDPNFDASLVDAASDSMVNFVQTCMEKWRQWSRCQEFCLFCKPISPEQAGVGTYVGVPADWKTSQGYPVKENLRYSDAALKTADNGKPLGDDTWWPESS